MKKTNVIKNLILYIFFFSICVSTFLTTFFDDMLFDIKTGEYILKHGIDFYDHFSCVPHLIYLYPHWLYDVIIFIFNYLLGKSGIIIFFGIIFSSLMYLFYYEYNKLFKNKFIAVIISFINMWLMCMFLTNRVQTMTYLLFFIEILLIEKLCSTGKIKYSVLLFIISILILNMHMPLWLLTVILFLPYVVSSLFDFIKLKKLKLNKIVNKKLLYFTFIIIIISGLFGIFGFEGYLFPFKSMFNNEYSTVTEMRRFSLFDYPSYLLLIIVFLLTIVIPKIKIKLKDACMITGILIMSFMAFRNLAYTYLIVPYFLINIFSYNFNLDYLNKIKYNNKINILIYSLLIIFSISNITLPFKNDYGRYTNNNREIDGVIKYIKNNLDYENIRMYNSFNDGTYLLYNDILVSIDMRLEVYVTNFNGGISVLTDYYDSTSDEVGFDYFFNKYKLNYILLDNNTKRNNFISEKEFEIIYEDDNYKLYHRLEELELNYCINML